MVIRYLIDGYNVLFRFDPNDTKLETRRYNLLNKISQLKNPKPSSCLVIFDATSRSDQRTRSHYKEIEVVFTEYNETADQYILSYLNWVKDPKHYVIVSSDQCLLREARSIGSKTESSELFLKKIEKIDKKPFSYKKNRSSVHSPPPLLPSKLETEEERWLRLFQKRTGDHTPEPYE